MMEQLAPFGDEQHYAHPSVAAITWWDFTDAPGHFWPHGGFLRPDLTPKESYERLQRLITGWRAGA
ncbi:MAG: hypothetical protein GX456_08075 [Verrucomicrobia bacterium]|nr:hypothetical protein [Verrucomicrobiota bacterium]